MKIIKYFTENGKTEKIMAMGSLFGKMESNLKDNFIMIVLKAKGFFHFLKKMAIQELNMMDFGKKLSFFRLKNKYHLKQN